MKCAQLHPAWWNVHSSPSLMKHENRPPAWWSVHRPPAWWSVHNLPLPDEACTPPNLMKHAQPHPLSPGRYLSLSPYLCEFSRIPRANGRTCSSGPPGISGGSMDSRDTSQVPLRQTIETKNIIVIGYVAISLIRYTRKIYLKYN